MFTQRTSYCNVCSRILYGGQTCCGYNGNISAAEYDAISYGIRSTNTQSSTPQSRNNNNKEEARNTCDAIRRAISKRRNYVEGTKCIFITYICKSESCKKAFGYNHLDASGKTSAECFDLSGHKKNYHNGDCVDYEILCEVRNPFTGIYIDKFTAKRDNDILYNVSLWDKIFKFF